MFQCSMETNYALNIYTSFIHIFSRGIRGMNAVMDAVSDGINLNDYFDPIKYKDAGKNVV